MGVVLRGRDLDLGRELAVKVLLPEHRGDPDFQRRFTEEARIAGGLQHPGVVAIHELGWCTDGRPFFAMKLVEGRTLAHLLGARTTPAEDLPRFLGIFQQVCQTLAYAHARGVIHRDVKPSNIMVGGFGEVQVMDWGLAKLMTAPADAESGHAGDSRCSAAMDEERSWAGSILGTPSYMAPEQARGEVERVDGRADVFGLGALLCEMLTGAPPFAGDRGTGLVARSARGDLSDAFTRLDASGADAELVRLARDCLAPQVEDRPRDAGVVAVRITTYLAGVRERLRAAEVERAAAEARARAERRTRKLIVVLAALVLLTAVGVGTAFLWRAREWAERERAVQAALREADFWQRQARWADARAAAERAQGRLASGGPEELRQRVTRLRGDLLLVARLEDVRLSQTDVRDDSFDVSKTDGQYEAAFRDCGLDLLAPDPTAAFAHLSEAAVREQALAALDNWLAILRTAPGHRRERLLEAARRIDPDPWHGRVREAQIRGDRRRLEELAAQPEVTSLAPASQLLLADGLRLSGALAIAVKILRAAQKQYPHDFWLNHHLALHLANDRPPRYEEAIRYYTAANALRPGSPGLQVNLAFPFFQLGRLEEAADCYRHAIQLRPDYAAAHGNLGLALQRLGRLAEALTSYREVVRLRPTDARAHHQVAAVLYDSRRICEAEASYREVIRLQPSNAEAHTELGLTLRAQDRLEEAAVCHREAIRRKPNLPEAHFNLGQVLRDQGQPAAAVDAYREALRLRPSYPLARDRLTATLNDLGRPTSE
jgi:serine/threonine-protein kinase